MERFFRLLLRKAVQFMPAMKEKKNLMETNPYPKDPAEREAWIF